MLLRRRGAVGTAAARHDCGGCWHDDGMAQLRRRRQGRRWQCVYLNSTAGTPPALDAGGVAAPNDATGDVPVEVFVGVVCLCWFINDPGSPTAPLHAE